MDKKKIDGEGKIVELDEAKVGKRKYNTGLCLGCVFLINNDRRLSYKEKLLRRVTSIIYIKVEVIGDASTHLHFYHHFFGTREQTASHSSLTSIRKIHFFLFFNENNQSTPSTFPS